MKRVFAGWACTFCLLAAVRPAAADDPPAPKNQALAMPINDLDERAAAIVKQVTDRPTVHAHGPVERFTCTPEQYYWLLDNPDRAVVAWRRLGAKCVSIQRRGPASFGYKDDAGTDVTWQVIHKAPGVRIWYAEGKVKPNAILPLVPVKALVILRTSEGMTATGTATIQHQTEVVVHTDSKAAAAVAKLMGQSAPKLAEQGLGQLQLFFAALSCYVGRHPERAELLFGPEK